MFHDTCKLWETQSLESVNIYWDITTFIHLHIPMATFVLKSRDITLMTKFCIVKAMIFPVVMYGCES